MYTFRAFVKKEIQLNNFCGENGVWRHFAVAQRKHQVHALDTAVARDLATSRLEVRVMAALKEGESEVPLCGIRVPLSVAQRHAGLTALLALMAQAYGLQPQLEERRRPSGPPPRNIGGEELDTVLVLTRLHH